MDNAPRVRFVSLTFLAGFGIGAFLGVALALLAVAIARPPDEDEPQVIRLPGVQSPTPQLAETPEPDESVRATAALTVRVGPGSQFATLGTISRGDAVDVVGRDFDSEWLAIRFPPGSNARGWIPADDVEGLSLATVRELDVLLPTPLPIEFSTPPPFFGTPGSADDGPDDDDATPDPLAGTLDLAILDVSVLPDGRVQVVVLNAGPADMSNQVLLVAVRNLSGIGETLSYTGIFPADETITFVTTSFTVGTEPQDVQIVVDPSSSISDRNRSNNVATGPLARASGAPTPAASGAGSG